MLDSDLSHDHQHRTKVVSAAQARRDRFFVPLLLLVLVLFAGAMAWGFYEIQRRNLTAEGAIRLIEKKVAQVQAEGSAPPAYAGPVGLNNPEAVATAKAFPALHASLKAPTFFQPDPVLR